MPVLLPRPFPGTFDYAVPADLDPKPGDVVLVPLNRREEVGVVWDGPSGPTVADGKLKPITAILESAPIPPALRRLLLEGRDGVARALRARARDAAEA